MKRFTQSTVLTVIGLLVFVPLAYGQDMPRVSPGVVGLSESRLERLTQTLQAYVEAGRLPEAVALIARRGKIAYLKSFGNRDVESSSPMGEEAIFRIASQTKAIVSVGIMILQEEGCLLISDDVGNYIHPFQNTTVAVVHDEGYYVVPAKRKITVRDLLTHTAGIGYGGGSAATAWKEAGIQGWYFADRDEPIGATIGRMASLPFDAQSGEKFVYGYNTDILGAIIEVVSGMTLNEFLSDRILEPFGMEDTHFYLPAEKTSRLATVYGTTEKGGLKRAPGSGGMTGQGDYVSGPRKSYSGGAGYLSTAEDYDKFLQMVLNGGEYNGRRILSSNTVELMTSDHLRGTPLLPGVEFGLGFSVVTDLGARGLPGSLGEFGWGGACHSTYWIDPKEDLIVVYFTQVIPAAGLDDHGKLRALVYQAIVD